VQNYKENLYLPNYFVKNSFRAVFAHQTQVILMFLFFYFSIIYFFITFAP